MKNLICIYLFLCVIMPANLFAQKEGEPNSQGDNPPHLVPSNYDSLGVRTNFSDLRKYGEELYLIEKSKKYRVDSRLVTVKIRKEFVKEASTCYKLKTNNSLGYSLIEVPKDSELEVFANNLAKTGYFSVVEYNAIWEHFQYSNDSYYSNQWYLSSIMLHNAWDITMGNQSNIMAVIDSGIDLGHHDLYYGSDSYSNVINGGWDYVFDMSYTTPSFSHGTEVAGVACAKTNNNLGIAGVSGGNNSAGIRVFSYNVYDPIYGYSSAYIPNAIIDAVDDSARVINISLGGPYSQAVADALNYAYSHGVSVVCASGNDGIGYISFPASYYTTIGVGAYNAAWSRATFSNYGYGLDLVAPGVNIYTTTLNNGYIYNNGTSFASPIVAGVIALMLSVNPSLSPDEIRAILHQSSKKFYAYSFDSFGWNSEVGYGFLDAEKAVSMAPISILDITGPDSLCGSEIYKVENIPSSFVVNWSFKSGNNSNLIQQNYPVVQQCIINIDNNENVNDTLVATIKFNGSTVTKLEKAIATNWNFVGTLSQEGNHIYNPILPTTFSNRALKRVWPGCAITITSPFFKNVTLSHSSVQSLYWYYDNDETISILFDPTIQGTQTLVVTGSSSSACNNFMFRLTTLPRIIDPLIIPLANQVTLRLNEEVEDYLKKGDDFWKISICNAETGKLVYEDVHRDTAISINTSQWMSGLYLIKITVGTETVTKKIVLNR